MTASTGGGEPVCLITGGVRERWAALLDGEARARLGAHWMLRPPLTNAPNLIERQPQREGAGEREA